MTEAEAVGRARAEAAARGWEWVEPTRAARSRRLLVGPASWEVTSNAGARGRNVVVVLDDRTGEVTRADYRPR